MPSTTSAYPFMASSLDLPVGKNSGDGANRHHVSLHQLEVLNGDFRVRGERNQHCYHAAVQSFNHAICASRVMEAIMWAFPSVNSK